MKLTAMECGSLPATAGLLPPSQERRPACRGRQATYCTVLSEILARHLGATDLKAVFPGFTTDPRNYLGFLTV